MAISMPKCSFNTGTLRVLSRFYHGSTILKHILKCFRASKSPNSDTWAWHAASADGERRCRQRWKMDLSTKKKAKHQKCAILFRFCSEIRILRFFLFFSGVYHWFLFRISCRKCWFRRMSTKTKTNLHGLWPTCCLNTLFFPTLLFHWLWPPKTVICWGLWVYNIYNNMFDTYNIL